MSRVYLFGCVVGSCCCCAGVSACGRGGCEVVGGAPAGACERGGCEVVGGAPAGW